MAKDTICVEKISLTNTSQEFGKLRADTLIGKSFGKLNATIRRLEYDDMCSILSGTLQ